MASEAKRRANIAYNKSRDNIMIRPTKEHGAKIRAAAAAAGQSVQAYILQAIDTRMKTEGLKLEDLPNDQTNTCEDEA